MPSVTDEAPLPEGVARVRAPNPGPFTLSGTNTYLVGSPAWVIDPGPADDRHVERVVAAAAERGGVAGIVITHSHLDHAGAVAALEQASGATVAAPRRPERSSALREPAAEGLEPDIELAGGDTIGPFEVLATPGHAPDHVSLLAGSVLFCGDTLLGEGSVFIAPGEDSLRAYLASLERLAALELSAICPGHGPVVWDPRGKLGEYLAHRLERERLLVEALESGLRTQAELLDAAWSDAPAELRSAAMLTLEAHLEKLEGEGRLPEGVERLRH